MIYVGVESKKGLTGYVHRTTNSNPSGNGFVETPSPVFYPSRGRLSVREATRETHRYPGGEGAAECLRVSRGGRSKNRLVSIAVDISVEGLR